MNLVSIYMLIATNLLKTHSYDMKDKTVHSGNQHNEFAARLDRKVDKTYKSKN
jgi:hypothetical protein